MPDGKRQSTTSRYPLKRLQGRLWKQGFVWGKTGCGTQGIVVVENYSFLSQENLTSFIPPTWHL